MNARRPSPFSSERGATLLAAMIFAAVLALALGSYLTLCHRTLALSSRAMHGERSVELAEAGIEDALWALNRNDWSGWSVSSNTATRTIEGFNFSGGATGSIALRVTNVDGSGTGERVISVTGTARQPDGTSVSRTLSATSKPAPLFVNAIAAVGGAVTFNSSGAVDSYDSSAGAYASQTPGYSAIVASTATPTAGATVQLTNAHVKGYVASRYSGGPSYGTSGTLTGPATPAATKIDPARTSTSPYAPVFDTRSITGAGTTLASPAENSVVVLGTPGATSPQKYYAEDLDLTGSTRVIVDGPVQLVVAGAFYVARNGGTAGVEITANGSLDVFVTGHIGIAGAGINNTTQDPRKLAIYAGPSWWLYVNTTTPLHGVIYAPERDLSFYGDAQVFGAIVGKNVGFLGSQPQLHYDVRLRETVFNGVDTPFAISDWRETTHD